MLNRERILTDFFASYFGVTPAELPQVSSYLGCTGPAWEAGRDVAIQQVPIVGGLLDLSKCRTQPREREKYHGMDADMSAVCVHTILLKRARNPYPVNVALSLNFKHKKFEEAENEYDKLAAAMGYVPGAFEVISANFDGPLQSYALKPGSFELGPAFAKTNYYLTGDNLFNGIVKIPPEICMQAGLPNRPVVYTPHGTKVPLDQIQVYFAVPPDHVLAWKLILLHEQRRKRGIYAEEFYQEDLIKYYLVPDVCMRILIQEFNIEWASAIDRRPLHSVGINVVPQTTNVQYDPNHPIQLDVGVGYVCFPRLSQEAISKLAPVVHPDMPTFQSISSVARQQAELEKIIKEQEKKVIKIEL